MPRLSRTECGKNICRVIARCWSMKIGGTKSSDHPTTSLVMNWRHIHERLVSIDGKGSSRRTRGNIHAAVPTIAQTAKRTLDFLGSDQIQRSSTTLHQGYVQQFSVMNIFHTLSFVHFLLYLIRFSYGRIVFCSLFFRSSLSRFFFSLFFSRSIFFLLSRILHQNRPGSLLVRYEMLRTGWFGTVLRSLAKCMLHI